MSKSSPSPQKPQQTIRPSQQPIDAADIIEYLNKYDDFALELRCTKILNDRGWQAIHGGTYEDPVTKKTRQFDIRTWRTIDTFRISLAVECKALRPTFPLVVSRFPRTKEESFHEIVFCHPAEEGDIPALEETTKTIRLDSNAGFYAPKEPVGKSTIQIGRKDTGDIFTGDAETFEKWSQALASIHDLIMQSGVLYEKESIMYHIAVPVLVVSNGTLWSVDYHAESLVAQPPKKIEDATVFISKEYRESLNCEYTISHLHIYTEDGFKQFIDGLSGMGRRLADWFPMRAIEKNYFDQISRHFTRL